YTTLFRSLRGAVRVQAEALDQLLGEAAARALCQHRQLRADVDALGVARLVAAVPGHAHVADAHACDAAVRVVQHRGRGEAGVDLHAQRLGLRRQPRAQRAEA